jgi:spore germination cell wall hydrolase CwlJ-like protein
MRLKIVAMAAMTAALIICSVTASAGYFDGAEATKASAHAMAEAARQLGYGEDSAIIQAAKGHYNAAQEQIDAELDMLARVVYFEAGSSWISDRHQQLVACVVLNRCADARFPATIEANVYRKGQYACSGKLYSVSRAAIPDRCFSNARAAAFGEVDCPANVVWQAQFRQGKGVYEKHYNTFFCY